MASDAVLNFLQDQNRPYSVNDILQNVGKEYGKSAIQKALDKHVHKNKVMEKAYGKQKVYCIIQTEDINKNAMENEVRKMDGEINDLIAKLKSADEQIQQGSSQIKNIKAKLTVEEATIKRNTLKEEILLLKTKLDSLPKSVTPISAEEKSKIISEHENLLKEYKKRKRICMDITNSILENYPKTKKHLFEEIGIETDEDVNFNLD